MLAEGRLEYAFLAYQEVASPEQPASLRGEAMLGLGRCRLAQGETLEATRYLKQAQDLLQGNRLAATAARLQGEAWLELYSFRLARQHLERAYDYLPASPERERTAFLLAMICREVGDLAASERYRQSAGDREYPEYARWQERLAPAPVPPPLERVPVEAPTNRRSLKFMRRKQWRARQPQRNLVRMHNIQKITVHHTGEPNFTPLRSDADVRKYLLRLQRHDQKNLGWADIGYHFLIDPRGKVWEGRALRYQGAHAGNSQVNRGNIGIALTGNFEQSRPTSKQIWALQELVGYLKQRYALSPSAIWSHNLLRIEAGLAPTQCPGHHLEKLLPVLFSKS